MNFFSAAQRLAVAGSFLAVLFISFPADSAIPAGYKGFPYHDTIQQIPGRVRLSRFDQGMAGKTQPEATLDANTNGVTWHDFMPVGQWACHYLRAITGPSLQVMGPVITQVMASPLTNGHKIVPGYAICVCIKCRFGLCLACHSLIEAGKPDSSRDLLDSIVIGKALVPSRDCGIRGKTDEQDGKERSGNSQALRRRKEIHTSPSTLTCGLFPECNINKKRLGIKQNRFPIKRNC